MSRPQFIIICSEKVTRAKVYKLKEKIRNSQLTNTKIIIITSRKEAKQTTATTNTRYYME